MLDRLKSKKGISIIIFLALLLMLTLIGVVAINNSLTNMDVSYNRGKTSNLLYSAEAGTEKAFALIKYYYDHHDTVMNPVPTALPSDTFLLGKDSVGYYTICDAAASLGGGCGDWLAGWRRTVAPPVFRNISAWSNGYIVVSEAWTPGNPRKVRIKQQVAVYQISVFAFQAFYDTFDLEISPEWPAGGLIPYSINSEGGGGIHSNKSIYVESPKFLAFNCPVYLEGHVTAKEAIYHGHKYTGSWPTYWGTSDSVLITDAIGVLQPMKDASGWLDHNRSDWVSTSITRWGGTVEDSAHKISDLYLQMVLPEGKVPYDIIKRASVSTVSLENDAYLKIYNYGKTNLDTALWYDTTTSSWTNRTDTLFRKAVSGDSVIKRVGSYDYRENDTLICYRLDIGRLNASGFYPANGIIYITTTRSVTLPIGKTQMNAIIITNADSLPQPTTIASNLPVYIVGNFNTGTNHPPAAIIADAVTILSDTTDRGTTCPYLEEWDSATTLTSGPSMDWRFANNNITHNNTTVNACIMAGIVPTNGAVNYSGGLWNLARLLEDWTTFGNTLTINGSMTCFWRSQVANSPYKFPDQAGLGDFGVYRRPSLIMAYDEELTSADLIQQPGAPRLNLTVKLKRSVEEL